MITTEIHSLQIVLPVSLSYLEMTLLVSLILISAILFLIGRKYYILKQNNHDRSDSILNNIQDGVYRTDLDGNMLWCSPSALRILRVNSPAIIKKVNVKDFYVYPEHRNELLTKLQENGQISNYETLLRRMDGSEIVISCNSSYWYDAKGEIAGIEGVFRDITENKQAKKSLIESEEKYRSLVEGASEAIFSVDSNGVFLYMNNVAAKRFNGNPKNFIGKTMWDIFPKNIADSQMSSIGKVFENGTGRSSQTITIIGGKKFRYSTNLQPIRDSLGKISAVLGVARDITSLIKTQQDLQNERDFVESLLETANSLIVCLDKYANITVFNSEIERLTGYSRNEVIGKSWPDIFLPKDHYHHKIDNFEEWVRKNPSDQLEAQIKTKTGEIRTILWSNSTLFHAGSDEFTAITVGLDITEKKKIEEAQIESETRFKESLKYSQAILYRLNLKTNTYDYMSEAVYDITGYTPEEVIAMGADGVNALAHPDDRDIHLSYRYKLFETDKGDLATHYFESRIKGKDGKYIWSGDSHALVRDENGEPLYIIGCARDITERKQIEQTLRQSELLNRKTLDSIDEAIHVINTDLEIVLINNTFLSWCDEFNLETDAIGKSIFDIFPFLPEGIREEYGQVLQTGESLLTEDEIYIGDKKIITETRKIPVMDNGTITSFVTIIRDITFQRQAEAARIESESRFHEALENSYDILYRLNLKTNLYDYMSNSVFKLTGYTRDEVLAVESDGINTITHPDDLKITENYRKRLIEADQGKEISHTIEYRIQHKDGHYIWLGDSHTLIRDAEGEPIYIIGVARDITAQKLSEIRHKARINLLNNLRKANDIDSCLEYGCQAIFEANLFERAVLTIHNDKKEIVNIGYIGLDAETIKAARNAPPPNDDLLAKLTQKQFRISNSYFIPAESGVLYVQTDRFVSQEDFSDLTYSTWSPGDELFVPIKGDSDKYKGWLSVDTPMNRKRPTLEIITLLEETVDIVTQKIREINAQNILDEKHNALVESEEKYRNLIDSSPDAIVIMKNGKVVFVNSMYNKLLGYKLGELGDELGFGKLIHKDDLEAVYQRMKDRKAGKEVPKLFSVTLVSRDGREVPCETSNSQIQYQGEPAEFITIRDMSEQKQIEEERKKSEKRYQELFDSILEGIGVVDENEVVQFCNPAFLEIFEVDSEEIIVGKNLLDFIPDNKKEIIFYQTMKRRDNISSQYEIEIRTHKGNKKIIYVSSSPHFNESGKYIGAFGAVIDLTEQKKAVDDLLQSEQFNKAVIEHSPLGVSVRSRTGKLLGYNKTWREIWGFTDEEIKEFTDRERTELKFDEYDDYLGKKLPDLKRIYTDGGYLHISDIHTPKARSRTTNLWVSQHFYAIKDASGNVDRVVILTEDITDRKIAEQKIKAIDSEKLIQAKRIAGTFAHEIRNALFPATASINRIKLSSQSSNNDKEKLKKYTLIAERSITRAADITGLITSYTKLDTEQIPEWVNINEIVKELLNNNQLRLLENKVVVNTTGGNNCLIKSNRRQLLLAFNNLLLNSIDAMVEKGKTEKNNERKINIQWFSNDDCYNISFEDNGCGIRTEYLGRIFEAFFSQKSESGGTGIGLAMTKRIIEMYGGAISVKSVFGAGTTFNINLKNYTANTVDKNNNLE